MRGGSSKSCCASSLSNSARLAFARDCCVVIVLDALLQRVLQRGEAVEAELRGPGVVGLALLRPAHGLDLGFERRGFASQVRGRIVVRERHVEHALVAGLGADQVALQSPE